MANREFCSSCCLHRNSFALVNLKFSPISFSSASSFAIKFLRVKLFHLFISIVSIFTLYVALLKLLVKSASVNKLLELLKLISKPNESSK